MNSFPTYPLEKGKHLIALNPSVGIFWYDSASCALFGVRKQEVMQAQIEAVSCDGSPFIIYPETNEEVWQQEQSQGD